MNNDLADIFPQLNDPAWIEEREQCWQLAMQVGEWKKNYRKKDLEKLRDYFFKGVYPEGLDITKFASGSMFKLFPIQTAAGYDYYYQHHEISAEQMRGQFTSAFLDQSSHGLRWPEQKAYFDYHVGTEYLPTKVFSVKTGMVEVHVDAIGRFKQLNSDFRISLRGEFFVDPRKLKLFLPYYASLVSYLKRADLFEGLLDDRKVSKFRAALGKADISEFPPENRDIMASLVPNLKAIWGVND